MGNLSTALNSAANGLFVTSSRTALTSRNITNANDTDYSRRDLRTIASAEGGTRITGYGRSADAELLDSLTRATSANAGRGELLKGLEKLSATVGDPSSGSSMAGLIGKFRSSLQTWETSPSATVSGAAAMRAASNLAQGLNDASATVQSVRESADADMARSVATINDLLKAFEVANTAIVKAEGTSTDITDALDTRDRILKSLSSEIGIRAVVRSGNDMAIYTDGGATLFEKIPRAVTMAPTQSLGSTVTGKAVYVDGVPITDPSGPMASHTGRLAALAHVRDVVAPDYQNKLDELARGLISAFAEKDPATAPTLPDATGVFTWSGAPAVPPDGTLRKGLAAEIRIAAAVDPARGGDVRLLRDGGINGAGYSRNPTGVAGYSAGLNARITALDTPRTFDVAAGLSTQATLSSYAGEQASWLEGTRKDTSAAAQVDTAFEKRATDALQRHNGVNIDEEMMTMLELERSYQASAKLMSALDSMLKILLEVV